MNLFQGKPLTVRPTIACCQRCQRFIADRNHRGHYGAFLMDDLPSLMTLVETLHKACPVEGPGRYKEWSSYAYFGD
jgi:hypothetical protein